MKQDNAPKIKDNISEKSSSDISGLTDSAATPSSQTPKPKVKSHKKTVIIIIVVTIVVGLITSSGMAFAFLVGRQYGDSSIEEKRQTVVQEGEVIADIAQRVGPSVVSVVTQQSASPASLYFGQQTRGQAAGTGFMIDDNGLILTNKHVVPQETSAVEIITADGTRYEDVDVIGRDPLNDLAILKVKNPKDFKAIALADSDKVRTGQKVIAIGNALGQFQNTVTSGIVSGQGRPVQAGDSAGGATELLTNLFQTDAAINSGNSGGPLLNFNGEVIGVNTAVAADAENVGFSIPINEAKSIITSVQQTGKLQRPYIGVRYILLTPDIAKQFDLSVNTGAYIQEQAGAIISDGPAQKAGVEPGDIITKVDSTEINEKNTPQIVLGKYNVGDTVNLTIVRGDKTLQLEAKLAAAPEE